MAENPIDFQLGADFSYLGLDFRGAVESEVGGLKLIAASCHEIDLQRDILDYYQLTLPDELNAFSLAVDRLYLSIDTQANVQFSCVVELENKTLGGDLAQIGPTDKLTLRFDIAMRVQGLPNGGGSASVGFNRADVGRRGARRVSQ